MPDPASTALPVRPTSFEDPASGLGFDPVLPSEQSPIPRIPEGADRQEAPPTSYELGRFASTTRKFLRALHLRGKLLPLLREAEREENLLRRADELGLTIPPLELQSAADTFRQQRGMASADETAAWLQRERLTTVDFDDIVRRDTRIAKLKDHVTSGKVATHFDADPSRYDRARIRHLATVHEASPQDFVAEVTNVVRGFVDRNTVITSPSPLLVFQFQLPQSATDILFAAAPGDTIGPIAIPPGQHFFVLDTFEPGQLDEITADIIRKELFGAWVADLASDGASASDFLGLVNRL